MPAESLQVLSYIALIVSSGAVGFFIGRMRHQQEIREWQSIARKAQMLNRLADTLKQERATNGYHEHTS